MHITIYRNNRTYVHIKYMYITNMYITVYMCSSLQVQYHTCNTDRINGQVFRRATTQ